MDQKNTIVKCTANPNCLFNHNGICDNYVIIIGADGSCQEYVETEQKTCHDDCIHFDNSDPMVGPICLFKHPEPLKDFYEGMPCKYYYALHKKPLRGWRAKGDFLEDACDLTFCRPNCIFCTTKKDSYYCTFRKGRIDGFGFMCSKYKEQKDEV